MEEIIAIKALQDNYIWTALDATSKHAFIVDPGAALPVIEAFKRLNLSLSAILITHHHWDHTNGIEEILSHFGPVPVIGSARSLNPFISQPVIENDEFSFVDNTIKVIEIPGHTLDHTAYFIPKRNILFTGDTLFSAGCGRIFEGTPEMMFHTLTKLASLPDTTNIYCGHEYTAANLRFAQAVEPQNSAITEKINNLNSCTLPSTLAAEKMFNPFLRCHLPSVKMAAENQANKLLDTPLEVFTAIREWKNHANF